MPRLLSAFFLMTAASTLAAPCPRGLPNSIPSVVVKMPYPHDATYERDCHQGPCGTTSHSALYTQYALDLDTPNSGDPRILLACTSGIAYTYNTPGIGVGRHLKIDIGDGTYFVYGHLHDFLIPADGVFVRQGQPVARENNSGSATTGDHLHFDRLVGRADVANITSGVSVPFKVETRIKNSAASFAPLDSTQFECCDQGCPEYDSNNISGCCSEIMDLDCYHWAWDYWQLMLADDIIEDEACAFDSSLSCVRPDAIMTRAQLCKAAMVALDIDLIPGATEPFTDIGPDHPYHAYVATLYQRGVVTGCNRPDNTLFCPDDSLQRAPATKILIKTLKLRPDVDDVDPDHAVPVGTSCQYSCDANSFTDNTTDLSLCVYVETSKQMEFVSGYEDSGCLFGPNVEMTRSHVAKVLYRMLGWLENRDN